MSYTKEQLLARLQELQIQFAKYEHPAVLTVEAQAKYIGHIKGGLSKNLFLKDKKHRYYIVSALADTKVDMKVLSQRLGLGKGGLRMAPEEALAEILKVSLGCVTPFAVVNESARHVSLLLDQGFKTQECCFFHPLSNDMSICSDFKIYLRQICYQLVRSYRKYSRSLNTGGLDIFLKSIGREPAYVDLEANPAIGKDQPPDLASLVPSDAFVLPELPEKAASSQSHDKNQVSVNSNSSAVTAKATKPAKGSQKEKPTNTENLSGSFTDPEKFVEEILEKASAIAISAIKEDNAKLPGEQLGSVVSNKIREQLSLDLKNLATIFKNTAYTEGFSAGIKCQPKRL